MLDSIRELEASEVEARIGTVHKQGKGVTLLLYKDARADMTILDEIVGPTNWQRRHEFKDGRLYCSVGIWDDAKGEWVWKEDVGTESNMEADKGQASDAFKRACVNWGIGRELYTAPFIWVPADKCNIVKGNNGTYRCFDRFDVVVLECENHVIRGLQIDLKGVPVFTWGAVSPSKPKKGKKGASARKKQEKPAGADPRPTREQAEEFRELAKGMSNLMGVGLAEVYDHLKGKFGTNAEGNLDVGDMGAINAYMATCVSMGTVDVPFEEQ